MKQLVIALFIIFTIGWFAPNTRAETSVAIPSEVFVLAGQSNMVGRGQPLSSGETPNPHLLNLVKKKWQIADDPLGNPNNPENGIGPGMTFGLRAVSANPDKLIGLVMCAKGATSIDDWQPKHDLYKKCVKSVKATKAPVSGVLFLQGETEAHKKKLALRWEAGFENVYRAFQSDLGGQFLLGQIGTIEQKKYPYQQIVRDQQAQAATDYGLPLVTTSDLLVSEDKVHFTVDSYKIVGDRFAAALNN